MITEAEFRALAAQGYNRIPLVEESFADLDTPLSLYLKLANAPYSFLLESVVGRRALRALLVHRAAREGPAVRARARGRGLRRRWRRRDLRRRSARVRRGLSRALPRGAAARPAALLRRPRRHLRLRRGAPHRDEARAHRQAADAGAGRRAGPPAAADRGARGRRQPEGQDLAHRLRRSRAARRVCAHPRRLARCAASCASR